MGDNSIFSVFSNIWSSVRLKTPPRFWCNDVYMSILQCDIFWWKLIDRNFFNPIFNTKVVLRASPLFSSPDPKGHVSYCHHLASVVRRKLFQKSSPLKVLDQWKPNLVWIITRVSNFKIVSGDVVHQPTWPLLLKIEHMVKLQVLGNNSKTVNNIKNLTWGKNDQHIKIYLPCNFEINLITHLGVIALFSSIFFLILILFVLYFKNYLEIDVKFKLQKCAAYQDLPTLQFWSKSHYPFWSYFPFFIKFSKF